MNGPFSTDMYAQQIADTLGVSPNPSFKFTFDNSATDATNYVNDKGGIKKPTLDPEATGLSKLFANIKDKLAPIGAYTAAHPVMSAGLGTLGALNLGGLFDGNGIAGQLVGSGLGGAASLLSKTMSPQGRVMAALAGGTLGSLFDKLRDKQDQAYEQDQQNQQMRQMMMLQAMQRKR